MTVTAHAVDVGLRHDLAHFGVNGGPLDIACATAATERQNVVKAEEPSPLVLW
jgi:hypothetical protein